MVLLGEDGNNKKAAILGKKGATIRAIQTDTGARLDLEYDSASGSSCLEISGTQQQVGAARRAVETILSDLDAGLAAAESPGEAT